MTPAREPVREYPRPQLRRSAWHSLDGRWRFAWDDQMRHRAPAEVASDKQGLAPPQGKSLAPSPSGSAKKTSGKK